MNTLAQLSADASDASSALPPLVAEAERAAAMVFGVHGKRASGHGESFWQYRQAMPGDPQTRIDWRRSGRSDELYVRETEWETAQSVYLWADDSASMQFASKNAPTTKARRAAVTALATAMLLERGGERFSLMQEGGARMLRGRAGVEKLAGFLTTHDNRAELGAPPEADFVMQSCAVYLSDFFGDLAAISASMQNAAARRVRGIMIQVNDPVEDAFPYKGRVLFESMGGDLTYEADRADALRQAYQQKLAERREALSEMAGKAGWRFRVHRTDEPIAPLLMEIHELMQAGRK